MAPDLQPRKPAMRHPPNQSRPSVRDTFRHPCCLAEPGSQREERWWPLGLPPFIYDDATDCSGATTTSGPVTCSTSIPRGKALYGRNCPGPFPGRDGWIGVMGVGGVVVALFQVRWCREPNSPYYYAYGNRIPIIYAHARPFLGLARSWSGTSHLPWKPSTAPSQYQQNVS